MSRHESEFEPGAADAPAKRFMTTRWSVVIAAGQAENAERDEALKTLCRNYWYPLYAYVRRQGRSREDAQELTQEFVTQLLAREWVQAADQERGRFRSFLLTAFKRFLANEYRRENAARRGGGRRVFSLDLDAAETRYQGEPADERTPEKLYERRWALTLLEHVMGQLQREYTQRGRAELFSRCRSFLTGTADRDSCALAGEDLNMSESAVRVAVHRLRRRYRELLQAEVAQTIDADTTVEDEITRLLSALRS